MTQSCYKRKAQKVGLSRSGKRRPDQDRHSQRDAAIVAPPIQSSRTSHGDDVLDGSKLWLNSSADATTRTRRTAKRNRYFFNDSCDERVSAQIAQNASSAYSVK